MCSSEQIHRNGHRSGPARCRGNGCGHPARCVPAAAAAAAGRAARQGRVEKPLAGRNSPRSIVRVAGVARPTAAKRAKKRRRPARYRRAGGRKKRSKRAGRCSDWGNCGRSRAAGGTTHSQPWLAVERASRRVVARVLGRRGAATARRLWAALPGRYRRHCRCFTDRFPASARAWPTGTHQPSPKGEGQASPVEVLNCSLRQRCGALVRRPGSFSNSLPVHAARIKICIDQHNQKAILA